MWSWEKVDPEERGVAVTRSIDGRRWMRIFQLYVLDQDGYFLATRKATDPEKGPWAPIEGIYPLGRSASKAAWNLAERNSILKLCTSVRTLGGALPLSTVPKTMGESVAKPIEGRHEEEGDDKRAAFRYEYPGGPVNGVAGVELQPFLLCAQSAKKAFDIECRSPVTHQPVNIVAEFVSLTTFYLYTTEERRTATEHVVWSVFNLLMRRMRDKEPNLPRSIIDQDVFEISTPGDEASRRQASLPGPLPIDASTTERSTITGTEPSEVVRGPDGKLYRRAVQAFIVNELGEFLTFQQPQKHNQTFRNCIQGGFSRGENWYQALERNLFEEAGLRLEDPIQVLAEVLPLSSSRYADQNLPRQNNKGEWVDERRRDFRYYSRFWAKDAGYDGQELYPVLLFMPSEHRSRVSLRPKPNCDFQTYVQSFWLPLFKLADCAPPAKQTVMEYIVSAVYQTALRIANEHREEGQLWPPLLNSEAITTSAYYRRIVEEARNQ